MKDTRIRSLIVSCLAMLCFSMAAKAQEAEVLSQLHDFRVNNFVALNAYYQFSATGATDTLNEVVAGINNANSALNVVNETGGDIFNSDQLGALTAEFESFKELMRQNINDVRTTGYPDLRLASEMANQAEDLSQISAQLYGTAREALPGVSSPRIEAARSAAVLMAKMMAKYSARSYSSVSQTFQGSDTEAALDEQARTFETLVQTLEQGDGSEELRRAIDGVATKWEFIRGSYINFNDDNVPFIIDRYSKGILEGLSETIELLRATA